ncbi:MAG: LysR family transcriptional regulator [Rhodospirillales bacterium]|nr:LysR family transcriptional regulator [Rhodospirillales bacterium]
MELYQVRYFLALCELLNFTRAAEKCNVSQPSLTRAIQNLEGEFGGPLFHRERQHTHLTELGRVMRPYFEQVYQQTQAARDAAKTFARLDNIPLKIGVMCTIGPGMLADLFVSFRGRYPGIEVEMLDATGSALGDLLLSGDIEVALYGLPEGIDNRFHTLTLFREQFVVVIAPTHRFASMPTVRCADLHEEAYVNRSNCEFGTYAGGILSERGIKVRRVMRSTREDWIQGMICAGFGFGFFPEYAVTMPGLECRPLIEPEMVRTVCLVTMRGRPHSPAVGAFVRAARSFPWPGSGSRSGDVAAAREVALRETPAAPDALGQDQPRAAPAAFAAEASPSGRKRAAG